jgi:hypothetical protein
MINDKVRNQRRAGRHLQRNRRLLLLADFLEKLPRKFYKNFRMNDWLDLGGGDLAYGLGSLENHKELGECGTSACALGWATQVPSLRRAGVTMRAICRGPHDVAERVFGSNAYWQLFLATSIKTPKQWAKRTRRWVKENTW